MRDNPIVKAAHNIGRFSVQYGSKDGMKCPKWWHEKAQIRRWGVGY
ncbi:hypothetical protein [Segatella salivae]|nr:hypothetical protein [Segatella salivae]